MEAIARWVTTLERGGIDLPRAQSIVRAHVGNYSDEMVGRWLAGEVIPGLRIRGHLFEAATTDFAAIRWEVATFMGEPPPALLPRVRALCSAARNDDEEGLLECLGGGGVVIDGWDEDCDHALGYAAEHAHASIAAILLRFGADPVTFAKGKKNAYQRVLERGDPDMLRHFLTVGAATAMRKHIDVASLNLVAASSKDNPEMIEVLTEHGMSNASALGIALGVAVRHARVRCATALVETGASVDIRDPLGRTPLIEASARGYPGLVEVLVKAGARVNQQDSVGNSALHHAVIGEHAVVVERLLSAGADPTLSNKAGELAASLASESAVEMKRLLLSVRHRGPSWLTPEAAPVMFVYNRGFGLGFDPRVLDTPILYGGDHDGIHHVDATFMESTRTQRELERFRLGWFLSYAEKLARREDFTFEELLATARSNGFEPSPMPRLSRP